MLSSRSFSRDSKNPLLSSVTFTLQLEKKQRMSDSSSPATGASEGSEEDSSSCKEVEEINNTNDGRLTIKIEVRGTQY